MWMHAFKKDKEEDRACVSATVYNIGPSISSFSTLSYADMYASHVFHSEYNSNGNSSHDNIIQHQKEKYTECFNY